MKTKDYHPTRWMVEMWLHPTLHKAYPARARVFREVVGILQGCFDPISRAADSWTPLLNGTTVTFGPLYSVARCAAVTEEFRKVRGLVVRARSL